MATLAGRDDAHPAIAGYSPGPAGELAIANGTLIDTAYHAYGTQAFAVELPSAGDDNTEFLKAREFALDLARSAPDPSEPVSHLGNEAPDFVPHTFTLSYGSPQTVEVIARRSLGPVSVHWRVGAATSAPPSCASRGRALRRPRRDLSPPASAVSGFSAGDSVRSGSRAAASARRTSPSPPRSPTPGDVLVLAAEDYSGTHPGPVAPRPGVPGGVHRRAARARRPLRRLRHGRPRPRARPMRSACSRTTTRSSGTRATTSSCASPPSPPARAPAACSARRSSPRATTSTTAAGCWSAASRRSMGVLGAAHLRPVERLLRLQQPARLVNDGRCVPAADDFFQY